MPDPLIVSDPAILGGRPVFAGTRVPVWVALYARTEWRAWVLRNYPHVTDAMIDAALAYDWPAVREPEIAVECVTLACACGEGYPAPEQPLEAGEHALTCAVCGRRWVVTVGVREAEPDDVDGEGGGGWRMSDQVPRNALRREKLRLEKKIDDMLPRFQEACTEPNDPPSEWELYWLSLLDAYEAVCDELGD